MRVFVDEQPVQVPRPTLAAAMEAGRSAAAARQRVIVEAKLDGVTLPDADLDQPSESPLGDADVRFVTAEPRALVRLSFLDTREALEAVTQTQGAAATDLQSGRMSEGLKRIGHALEVWDAVRRVAHEGPALLGVGGDAVIVDGRTLASRASDLAGCLGQVKGALSAQDWSFLADLMEGELTDAARAWRAVLADLAEQTARGRLGQSPEPLR